MSHADHVEENLKLMQIAPMTPELLQGLFK